MTRHMIMMPWIGSSYQFLRQRACLMLVVLLNLVGILVSGSLPPAPALVEPSLATKNLLSKCDVFSANFQIGHALTCKFWGPIHRRHNDISYDLKSLAAITLGNKSKQTEPLINPGSIFVLKSKQ